MARTALIAGATGAASKRLVEALLADPQWSVIGLSRNPPASNHGRLRYVSADLLATRAGLFRGSGGFDSLFLAGDYADVDYCLRVRAAGRRVVYQPQTAVVRHTEPAKGTTSADRDRFTRRWLSTLASLPAPPERFDDATWDRLARVA